MKVVHLAGGGDIGGAKTHILSLVKNLSKYIDVKVISLRPGPFADEAREMGIDVEVVYSNNIISDIRKVIKIIREGDYRLIHSHGAKANMFSVFAQRFVKLPTVTTVHSDYKLDYMHSVLKKYSFGIINTIALRFIDYYINVSKNLKEALIKRNFNTENIFMIPNGIDFNKFIPLCSRADFSEKYKLNLNENDIVVGILARLTAVKGLATFLEAGAEVLTVNSSVKFLIAGDGEDREVLEKKAASLGITENLYFLGFVNEPYEVMRNMDINVLTSISEGFPYVILEGAVLKKATISTQVGGISDLIDHGENGYLFQPGDHKTLAKYILELVGNSSKRLEMGEKMHEKGKLLFSLESMCHSQLNIYNTILTRKDSHYLYDVVISGYYGFNNSGDDAILAAIISNLRLYKPDIRILVLSKTPVETNNYYQIDTVNRLNLYKILKIMRHSRLFINGGGNLVQDGTSTRSLMYYLGMTWLAKKMGTKIMIYANGIGPVNKKFNKRVTQKILNQSDVITLREELSKKELANLNIDKPRIIVTADPALTVEAVKGSIIDNIFQDEDVDISGPLVGISVREWEGHEVYEEIIARTVDYMIEKYHIRPVFIPMHYPSDLGAAGNITSKMKNKSCVIKSQYDAASTLGIISRMDMLIGMRLHSLIYAASLGIPVIGLVYESKVEAFLQYFHQASAGHVKDLELEKLKELVDDVWSRKAEIKKELRSVTTLLKEKAFENAKIAVDLLEENR